MKQWQNIVLIGFMGSGKSTVGKRLAKALDWEFIDTDAEVERVTGVKVPDIFRRHGEMRFRSEESLVVKRLSGRRKLIIATGGGTVVNPDNWQALAQSALIIGLYAPVETILARIGHRHDRPLLKGSLAEIEELWQSRQKTYAKADLTVDTTEMGIEEVVEYILGALQGAKGGDEHGDSGIPAESRMPAAASKVAEPDRMAATMAATMATTIEVRARQPYSVQIGVSLRDLGPYLESELGLSGAHLLIITNPQIAEYHLAYLLAGLGDFRVDVLRVPAGEEEKSLERLAALTTDAVACGADRHTVVLALGGGVVGDLAGFFASTFMRGVRFVQVPTTLLAQVDSSIGGKVAVNHEAGKNLLGAFHPPLVVWTDLDTLHTLPWAEVQNGLAESIKHALIADHDLFVFLEQNVQQIRERDADVWLETVRRSSLVKIRIVSQDEQEQGLRALLNLGHSFGHALEKELGYGEIAHGQAVSIGLVAAAYLARSRGEMSGSEVERLIALLREFGLPVRIAGVSAAELLKHMGADKKNQAGRKVLILPQGIGRAGIAKDCSDAEILSAWEQVIV